ncbi:MAG: glycosyltransferase, partial [Candidatus Korobacteraceae bacterium]
MDLCAALVEAGFQVTVVASDRGYDNPTQRYLREEVWQGVRIARVSNLGLGKAARWRRAADFASFMAACAARVASLGHFDLVIALTSPPLISYLASLCVPFKADALVFWAMDLNPDEAIAAGWLREGSLTARLLSSLQLSSMRKARRIVALDRFMKQRLLATGLVEEKIAVIPPWSHDHWVRWDPNGRDAFRLRHNHENKIVVMNSGNHSPCHPLETLVRAARHHEDSREIVFCFVGG